MKKMYYSITYGCQMNESDTERINEIGRAHV